MIECYQLNLPYATQSCVLIFIAWTQKYLTTWLSLGFFFSLQQASPSRREDRPVSFYQLGSSQLQPNVASLARDAANVAKDKQRSFMPSLLQNETYGAVLSSSPPPIQPTAPVTNAPPLPPRNIGKGTNVLIIDKMSNGRKPFGSLFFFSPLKVGG